MLPCYGAIALYEAMPTPFVQRIQSVGAFMSTSTQHQVRTGQTWAEMHPHLGLRVFIIQAVRDDSVHMRTVFDEGIIGVGDITVTLKSFQAQQVRWQFVSEPCPCAQ